MKSTPDNTAAGIGSVRSLQVDMESFLSKHDIVYHAPPTSGWEGFPFGNGSYGGMYWTEPEGIVFQANHTDTLEEPDPEAADEGWAVLRSCGRLLLRHPLPVHDWLYVNRYHASHSLYRATVETRLEMPSASLTRLFMFTPSVPWRCWPIVRRTAALCQRVAHRSRSPSSDGEAACSDGGIRDSRAGRA